MTTVDTFLAQSITPEPERNRWGQYVLPDPETKKKSAYQRVTTFAKIVADTYNIERWSGRMGVKGLALRPDLLAQVAATDLSDKETLNRLVEEAKEAAGASVGRNLGSALHRFTEQVDRGEKITAPAPLDRDITAYVAAMRGAGITTLPQMIERVVRVKVLEVAGTFDRVLTAPDWSLPRIGDVKSAQEVYGWLEIAVQLACYSRADAIWDVATTTYEPMPKVDQDIAIVMHLPAGQGCCTLYEVDIAAGWEIAQIAAQVRAYRKRKDLARILSAVDAPDVDHTAEAKGVGDALPASPAPGLRKPDRADLEARVKVVCTMGGGMVALARQLAQRDLPKLSFCPDDRLHVWAQALAWAEDEMKVPFTAGEAGDREASERSEPEPPPAGPSASSPASPEVLDALRARYEALPVDIRCDVDAAKGDLPNFVAGCTVDQLERGLVLVAQGENDWEERKAYVSSLLQGLDDDIVSALLAEVGWQPGAGTAAQVAWLETLLAGVDAGVIFLDYVCDTPYLSATPHAEDRLLEAHQTKKSAIAKARTFAADNHRKAPRTFADVLGDPLTVALLTVKESA